MRCLLLLMIASGPALAGEPPDGLAVLTGRLDGIAERLARIEAKLDLTVELAKSHDLMLHGPPADGRTPGLTGRVQAVESYQRAHAWALGVLFTALIGAAVQVGRQAIAKRLTRNTLRVISPGEPAREVRRSKPWLDENGDRGPP